MCEYVLFVKNLILIIAHTEMKSSSSILIAITKKLEDYKGRDTCKRMYASSMCFNTPILRNACHPALDNFSWLNPL